MKNKLLFGIAFIGIIGLAIALISLNRPTSDPASTGDNVNENLVAVVHKSPTCGCCGNYVSYLRRAGFTVKVEDNPDLTPIKQKYNISSEMQSCHTTEIGGYFIEGHIPIEAVQKLLTEKPSIKGIALPGMPSGSPGMPGGKNEDFDIQQLSDDGMWSEFIRM